MRQISSDATVFHKKFLPTVLVIGWAMITSYWVLSVIMQQRSVYSLLLPILVAAFGYYGNRSHVFCLVDEVHIDGDNLVVRNGQVLDRVPLDNIDTIEESWPGNPDRIVLNLKRSCAFGKTITFAPAIRMWPFGCHPVVTELVSLITLKEKEMASAITARSRNSTEFTAVEH